MLSRLRLVSDDDKLPKECATKFCGSSKKEWYQDAYGLIYCRRCGIFLGQRQPGLLPFRRRDDNVIPN
jgi:hypothetical protein